MNEFDIEELAQEYIEKTAISKGSSISPEALLSMREEVAYLIEKVALSPETRGAAYQERLQRVGQEAGYDANRFPRSFGEAKGRLGAAQDFNKTRLGRLHARSLNSAIKSKEMGRFAEGANRVSSASPILKSMNVGMGRASDALFRFLKK